MKLLRVVILATLLPIGAGPALAQEQLPEPAQRSQHLGHHVRARIALQHHQRRLLTEGERAANADLRRSLSRSAKAASPPHQAALDALHRREVEDARNRWIHLLTDRETLAHRLYY